MSYRLIDANALNGVISNDDYEKVLNAPCIFADLPNELDGEHYNLQEPIEVEAAQLQKAYNKGFEDCRQAVMDCFKKWQPYMATRLHKFEKELSELPSVAIPSVEPREVIYSDDGYIANCPNCNCVYEIDDLVWGCNFCPKCGQALDWEIEDEED